MRIIFRKNDLYVIYGVVFLMTCLPFFYFKSRGVELYSGSSSSTREAFPVQSWYVEDLPDADQIKGSVFDYPRLMGAPSRFGNNGGSQLFNQGLIPQYLSLKDHDSFNAFDPSLKYNVWDFFHPQSNCLSLMRVGWFGDGGKWICDVEWLRKKVEAKKQSCVVYSFGVSNEMSFETQLERYTHCELHLFDPSIGKLPFYNEQHRKFSKMVFHKIAIGKTSGSSVLHLLVQSLPEIMLQLNHTFLDVLKVDVEGAEWDIFNHMLNPDNEAFAEVIKRNNRLPPATVLPVGQLLIELHHEDMDSTINFFQLMNQAGYLIISREINLQTAKSGGKPFASEFTFIHPTLYYLPDVPNSVSQSMMRQQIDNKNKELALPPTSFLAPIEAVIYYLTQRKRIALLVKSLQSLHTCFLRDFPEYPVVIFHDDFTDADKRYVVKQVPEIKVKFVSIHFSLPANLKDVPLPERTKCSAASSTIGYRHMCRFHAFGVHSQLQQNGFGYVEYIMRLDDDSSFASPIGYDFFRLMKINNKKYGFVNMLMDEGNCVEGLWPFARAFLENHRHLIGNKLSQFDSYPDVLPDGFVFYNNFEISHASIWQHPLWQLFVNAVDSHGGIYTIRWGDAPLHTIFVTMVLPKESIHAFTDISYRHDPFVNQNPTGLPPPFMDPFFPRFDCAYYSGWSCGFGKNSTNITVDGMNLLNLSGNSSQPHKSKSRVLFTYGHVGDERELVETIENMYQQFANTYGYRIVVFYTLSMPMLDIALIESLLKSDTFEILHFVVATENMGIVSEISSKRKSLYLNASHQVRLEQDPWSCVVEEESYFYASYFIRFEAIRVLRNLGYSWFMRFASNAKFKNPVGYDIFDSMEEQGKKFGFINGVWEREICVESLWNYVEEYCSQQQQQARGDVLGGQCGDYFKKWSYGFLMLSSFEVSHESLWLSPVCLQLHRHMRMHPLDTAAWSDSALHTACVVAALNQDQIVRFNDIMYSYTIDLTHSIVNSNPKDAVTASTTTSTVPDRTATWTVKDIPEIDQLFSPKTFGWLGGDIAASFPLPSLEEIRRAQTTVATAANENFKSNRHVWLFGDTLVGMSTKEKRVNGALMVGNSVGIATRSDESSLPTIKFSFGSNIVSGEPETLFTIDGFTLWPFSALTMISDSNEDMRLVVVGQLKAAFEPDVILFHKEDVLNIKELATGTLVVHNPNDDPSLWRYSGSMLRPGSTQSTDGASSVFGYHRWTNVVDSRGRSFLEARADQHAYLLGSFTRRNPRRKYEDSFVAKRSYTSVYRVAGAHLFINDLSQMEVYCDQTTAHGMSVWTALSDCEKPHVLFSPGMSEPSLHLDAAVGRWLAAGLEPMGGIDMYERRVRLCVSASNLLESSWTCSVVFDPPKPWNDLFKYILYAGKLHPELVAVKNKSTAVVAPDVKSAELVLSYVANTWQGFGELFKEENREAYTPKFARLSIPLHEFR